MRFTAISITIFSLLLTGCDVEPIDQAKELGKLEGPKPGSMSETLKNQGDQAVANGDFKNAAQNYRQLVDKEPDNKEYTLNLADSLRRSGDNQGALQVLEKYLTQHPDDAQALETKGLCLMNLGSIADAGKAFEQVIKIDPTRWRTLNAVGILFTMKGKFPEAIGYYDEALSNNVDNASVLNNKGLTLAMDRKYDDAIESFQRTKRNLRVGSPDMRQIDMNLALVYAIAGRLDDAERTASTYLSKPALYNNMGVYADLSKNPEMAKSYLNMALTQNPMYYERAWKNLGTLSTGDVEPSPTSGTLQVPAKADAKPSKKKAPKVRHIAGGDEKKLDQIPTPEGDAAGMQLKPPEGLSGTKRDQ